MSKTPKNRLSIVARPAGGFRRAGFNFSAHQPTVIDIDKLDDQQITLLKNEPNLVVVELAEGQDAPAPATDDAALKAAQDENAALKVYLDKQIKYAAGLEDRLSKAEADLKDAEKDLKAAQKAAKK